MPLDQKVGPWSWPRYVYRQLCDAFSKANGYHGHTLHLHAACFCVVNTLCRPILKSAWTVPYCW